jgi:hypothetical protein
MCVLVGVQPNRPTFNNLLKTVNTTLYQSLIDVNPAALPVRTAVHPRFCVVWCAGPVAAAAVFLILFCYRLVVGAVSRPVGGS